MTLRTTVAHNAPPVEADAKHEFQQNIMTADFKAPVLFAGVYEYDASELGFEGGGRVRVYYPPEAIADKDFVQSVFYSVLSVGTHEKNTREENASPDGFIRNAFYDDKMKVVFADGYIYGKKNVEYVTRNERAEKFGTSAFFRATYKPQKGVTPDGEEYDMIGGDLVCNHLAILENPRDDKNVVAITKVNRAVAQHVRHAVRNLKNTVKGIITMADTEKPAVDKETVRNALEEIKNEDAKANEISDLKNAMARMSDELAALKKPAETAPAAPAEAANAETEEKKDESAEAAHGLPAQDVVAAYAKHYGRDFGRVTPSFAALAEIADIKADGIAAKARAVVAHAKAIEKGETTEHETEAAHSAPGALSFAGFSKNI